jgi:hypothetical protein
MMTTLLSQATPALVDGKNALITVIGSGLDRSLESWEDASPFFSGKSRADMFVQLLSRLHAWEYSDAYFDGQNILPLLQAGAFPFVDLYSWPSEAPSLKAYAYASATGKLVSTFHVSWNGATEVAVWNFYGSRNSSRGFTALGTVIRTGFETTFVSEYVRWSYAEATAANGTVLGESETQQTIDRGTAADDENPGWQIGKDKALVATSTPVWRPSAWAM